LSLHGTLDTGLRVEIRTLGELAPVAKDMRALTMRACEPNVFYEPDFVTAAAPVFGRGVLAALVWQRGAATQLVGFFPVRITRHRYGLPIPVAVGWTHTYGPLGTPLVDRDCREAVVAAWLDHLAASPALPKLLLMRFLPVEGLIAQAFDQALVRRGGRSADFAPHTRALLHPDGDRAEYLARAIRPKKRKELRRQRHRLSDHGALESIVATGQPELAAALDDFFAIEASGWKGRAGTATRNDEGLRRFVDNAVTALARDGKASVARLSVGGRPVAAAITLRSGDNAWGWKIAYDEGFSRTSPGVQLLVDMTENLLDDTSIVRADSCATPGHPMINRTWRERLALADRLIAVDGGSKAGFAVVCALERARRFAENAARSMRNLVRGR
jgi:hypothetical protein